MPSEEFIDSVEELIADQISVDASMHFVRVTTGVVDRDEVVERIVRKAIRAALETARKQMSAPRHGSMTFSEAMEAVAAGKMVTRPGWAILRALIDGDADTSCYYPFRYRGRSVGDYRLDNLDGGGTGWGSSYAPTAEDLAATDWMIYQPPVDIAADFSD